MHHSTTWLCSSCDRVGLSPVVPTGTRPLVPSPICQSTMSRKAFSSSEPFLNGVTSAVKEPRKLVLAVMARHSTGFPGPGLHRYRVADGDDSPPTSLKKPFAAFLPASISNMPTHQIFSYLLSMNLA